MNELILTDEVKIAAGTYAKFAKRYMNPPKFRGIKKKGRFLYERFCVVSDNNPLGKFMVASFETIRQMKKTGNVECVSVNGELDRYDSFDYSGVDFLKYDDLDKSEPVDRCAFMICIDCEMTDGSDEWFKVIEKVSEYASKGRNNFIIVNTLLPEYPAIPSGIVSLAEREFSYFIEREVKEQTEGQKFYIAIEKLCRKIATESFENINIARIDNLYGPDSNRIRLFDIEQFIKDAFETGIVHVTTDDYNTIISCSYVRNVVAFAVQILYVGRKGQVYNFCTHLSSIAAIKNNIRGAFKDVLKLSVESESNDNLQYHCLNTLKFFQCGWSKKKGISFGSALYRTVIDLMGFEHNNYGNVAVYSGKLDRIKDLELMMLRDIDTLCRENDIKYFLCGGTMLGAVRYGHSIPWDDDLDIGMLRKDFDKFRKVCQEQQRPIYNYSSHCNNSGSHYIVDKVRLNGTYFSTRYSSVHEYPDGLFIDVLVYDQTSNNKFIGKLHSRLVHVLSKIIENRWYNKPKGNWKRKSRVVLLAFIRIFPLNFYHKIYEFVLKLFKNKKNAKYVIDSTGKLQKKGPFLMWGLHDVQRVDFDGGFQAPIPINYKNYLTFDYGPNYLPEPILSKRVAPHNFARIDLGEWIFETKEAPDFRDINVHGELFETEV